MDDRFLRYALEKERTIRAVWMQNGSIVQKTVHVLEITDDVVTFRQGKKGAVCTIPLSDVLACDYARGDTGEN